MNNLSAAGQKALQSTGATTFTPGTGPAAGPIRPSGFNYNATLPGNSPATGGQSIVAAPAATGYLDDPLFGHQSIDDLVALYFLRSDTPNGLASIDGQFPTPPAAVIERAKQRGVYRLPGQPVPAGVGNGQPAAAASNPYGVNGLAPAELNALAGQMSQAAAAAYNLSQQTGYVMEPVFDPVTQRWTYQRMKGPDGQDIPTLASQKQADEIATNAMSRILNMAHALGKIQDPSTGEWATLPEELHRQLADRLAEAGVTGTYQGQDTLAKQQQAFDQAVQVARFASNPRDYLVAPMLGQRGGLGPAGAMNQVQPTTLRASFVNPAQTMGQPGSPDHIATLNSPSGAQLHFFSSPTGEAALPLTATTRALLEGTRIPQQGAVPTSGGYVSQSQLQRFVNPSQWRVADYARMTPDEQAQAKAAASAAGWSDDQTDAALKAQLPKFTAPKVGGVDVPSI